MAVDARCLACDRYRDKCVGGEEACVDWVPIDWERAAKPPATVPSPLRPATETRREKFARIGKKQQQQALEAVRKSETVSPPTPMSGPLRKQLSW